MNPDQLPSEIKIDVDFYNDEEKKLLLKYSSSKQINRIVLEGLVIQTPEFLTYYLFHLKKTGNPNYSTYDQISKKIDKASKELEGFIDFGNNSIYTHPDVKTQLPEISEKIGESIGLSVVSQIHKLKSADWNWIPEQRGRTALKTFDYNINIASDNNQYIQVECKGSSVEDNSKVTDVIRSHKYSIKEKKANIRDLESLNSYPYPASLRYGTIVSVGSQPEKNVMCWLVDPKPEGISFDPQTFKLLSRLEYLHFWISFISPRSQLAASLATRIAAISKIQNPFELDGVPLYKANGESFDSSLDEYLGYRSSFFLNKSKIINEPSGGIILKLSDERLFFLGIREELISLASLQDFKKIMSFSFQQKSVAQTVNCVISKSRYSKFNLSSSYISFSKMNEKYVKFNLDGQIHYNSSGLLFGFLPLNAE